MKTSVGVEISGGFLLRNDGEGVIERDFDGYQRQKAWVM